VALLPANPGEALWIGPTVGKNHYNVGIGLGSSGGQAHEDFDQTLIEEGFVYSIAGGTDPYDDADKFYLNSDGNAVFRINAGAGRTSTGTAHPRSECRELTAAGGKAAWDGRTGWHYLKARCRIIDVTSNRPWVCFGQIHGSEGSPEPSDLVRLQTEGAIGATTNLKLVCRRSPPAGGGEVVTTLREGYDVNDWFNYEIHMGGPTSADNGRLRILIDGVEVLNATGMGQILNYFKFGCYLQDNVEKGATASDFAAVEFERGSVVTWHTGQPAPTTPVFTGGADGSGGADSQPPTAPADLVAVRGSGEITLSWQESTDNVGVDHYNIYRTGVGLGGSTTTETLGKLTDGASSSASSSNKTAVSLHTATDTGTLTGGHARIWISAGSTNTKCVVYADSAGAPGALLAESDVVVLSATAEAEVDYTFSGAEQITITSGTPYWIGMTWQDPGAPSVSLSRDGTASGRQENNNYLADPFGAPTAQTGPVDVYIDVEVTEAATATLGKTTAGASSTSSSADKIVTSAATSTTAGTLTEGHARLWLSSAGTTNAKMVVYADSGGSPGAELATSDQLAITNTTTADKTFTFSGAEQIAITDATDYWIAVTWDDPGSVSINYSRDGDTGLRRERSDITYGTPPDPWGTSTFTGAGPIDAWLVTSGGVVGAGEELLATTTATTYVDTDVTDGTEYTYRINAEDAAGNVSGSSASVSQTPGAPDTTAPTVPADLTGVAGDRRVTLTWSASTDADSGVDAYRLYRDGSLLVETDLLTYTDTGLTNGVEVTYTISAVDVAGNESAESSGVNATPTAASIGGVEWLPAELADARLQVQIAFGADLAADPATWTWTDVTEDVRQGPGISCSLGRRDESSTSNPADLALVLGNESGDYSLGGRSQYYPYVRRNTPVRVRVDPGDAAGPRVLFFGGADGFTPGWGSLSLTGPTRVVRLSASGVLRRLGQGEAPVVSPYRRAMLADSSIVAYWPMEEGGDSAIAPAARGGTELAIISGEPDWSSNDEFNCSAPLPAVKTGFLSAGVHPYTATGENEFRLLLAIPDDGLTDGVALCHISMTGSIERWDITYEAGADGPALGVFRWNDDGTRQGDNIIGPFPLHGRPSRFSLQVSQSGSDIVWQIGVTPAERGEVARFSGGTIAGETCGIVRQIEINPHGTGGDMAVGHVTVSNEATSLFDEIGPLTAYVGEYPTGATGRLVRLCQENGVRLTRYTESFPPLSVKDQMGPQLAAPLLELIGECEAADQAQVWDGRDHGLAVTTRRYRENGNLALTVDVAAGELAPGFAPVHDDQRTRNKWTITRLQGAAATYEDSTGPLGTGAIDVYDDSATVNTRFDDQAIQHAAWRVHLGTVEGYRFPTVTLDARAVPHLVPAALDVIPGDRIDLTGIADDAAPLTGGTVSLIVEGVEHDITGTTWLITFTCSLFSPWGVGRVAEATGDTSDLLMRPDTDGSTLASDAAASAVSLSVNTAAGKRRWTTTADDYPLYLSVGGLPVRATACSGTSNPQTFTVDALPVARTAGATVELWDPRPVGIG
jgi:hypothetical protein